MNDNLPVNWQEQMKADARSMLEKERPSLSMLSFQAGQMSIGDTPVPNNELTCVVVAAVTENVWYKDRYDPQVKAIPTCYAIGDAKAKELAPYDESPEKQSETCVTCPKFEWGSNPNGGRGKACKERRRLALIPADGTSEMLLASIPPTSLKNWSNFVIEIAATTGMPHYGVVAKIKVVPDPKNQFQIKFSVVEQLSDAGLQAAISKRGEAMEILTQPYPDPDSEEGFTTIKKRKF